MRVGIVGAGVSGLAAARTLTAAGHGAVLFEKADAVGGRVATQRIGQYVFDTGATSVAPRGLEIEPVMLHELDTTELVKVEKPIYTHVHLRVIAGDASKNATDRYTYKSGISRLPQMLAEGLDVRLGVQIESIEKKQGSYRLDGETFDAVILTPPIPQSSLLLWSAGESRPVANAFYRSCISVMLGYNLELPPTNYHALLDVEQRHPLTWLSLESVKSPGRAPSGRCALVAQMSPAYSLSHYEWTDEQLVGDVEDYLIRLYGAGFDKPDAVGVKRWKYSQPECTALFETVNRPGAKLLLAGDGLSAGRVERAYESGAQAANLLMAGR